MDEDPIADRSSEDEPQFEQAEDVAEEPVASQCTKCDQPIVDQYYTLNGNMVCEVCRGELTAALTGGSRVRRFGGATILGGIAAGVGSGIYFLIARLTGYEFSLVAIVVGLMVGGAVRYGCRGRGGWFYQLLAVFLTYTAIVTTYIPYIVQGFIEAEEKETATASGPAVAAEDESSEAPASQPTDDAALTDSGGPPNERRFRIAQHWRQVTGCRGVPGLPLCHRLHCTLPRCL